MDIRKVLLRFTTIAVLTFASSQALVGQEPLAWRILKWSDAEQASWIKSALDQGMPIELGGALNALVLNKSSLTLPLIVRKIEQVLSSRSPGQLFNDPSVDPQKFIDLAAVTIIEAGNEDALKAAGGLISINEKRFDDLVRRVLLSAESYRNPFGVAYRGLEIGDPAVDKRIAAWAEWRIGDKSEPAREQGKQLWATALVERYRTSPVQTELDNDPLLSKIKTDSSASLRADLQRYAAEIWEKHPRRMLAMSETEQIGFAKSYLDQGMPPERREAMINLIRGRSALVLPMIEAKLEEILKSTRLTLEDIEPRPTSPAAWTVMRGAYLIMQAGDEHALRESAKLLRLDARVFGQMVPAILEQANLQNNPFSLAYRGLEMGDAAVSKGVMYWVEQKLNLPAEDRPKDFRRQWAEAMLDRYGAAVESQWTRDPIASRLKPVFAESLRGDINRLATDATSRRVRQQ